MSNFAEDFVAHLTRLREGNRGALAELRRSLGFPLGGYPPAYPHVERFAPAECQAQDPRRLALYIVAGLFALHPRPASRSLAASFGELMRRRGSGSLEKRFIVLLDADAETLPGYLRQVVSLLMVDTIGLDYAALLRDIRAWLSPRLDPEIGDCIRQRWARDFYRALVHDSEPQNPAAAIQA